MRVHAHHLVFPETHGRWSKVQRFINWLRKEAGGTVTEEAPPTASVRPLRRAEVRQLRKP